MVKRKTVKMLKWKDLAFGGQRMWIIKKSDACNKRGNWKHLKIIQKISGLYRTAILGNAHILGKVQILKVQNYLHRR